MCEGSNKKYISHLDRTHLAEFIGNFAEKNTTLKSAPDYLYPNPRIEVTASDKTEFPKSASSE